MFNWKDDTGRMSWISEAIIDAFAATITLVCTVAFAFLESPAHALLTICALAFAFTRVLNGVEEYRYRRERRKRLERMWK
jgi:hypothetical protein